MNRHVVTVCGQSLCLISDEDESYIREITRTIDGIIAAFNSKRHTQGVADETRFLFAAIQLADSLFKERIEAAKTEEALRLCREALANPAVSETELEAVAALTASKQQMMQLTQALARAEADRDEAKAELEAFIEAFDK